MKRKKERKAWELKCYKDREALKMLKSLRLLLRTIKFAYDYETAYMSSMVVYLYRYAKKIISFGREHFKLED